MIPYTFVTQSAGKLAEAERILGVSLLRAHVDLPEIQAVDVAQVVCRKALAAYHALGGKPVLIEDTGLYFAAWNGLPGALVKWFVERPGLEGMCRMLDPFDNRDAWAETVAATYDGELKLFVGKIVGRIADRPTGENGFGWDAIFIPEGSGKTFAEMRPEEKDRYSMRRLAFQAAAAYFAGGINLPDQG